MEVEVGGGRWGVCVCVCVYTMSMACPIQFVCPSHLSTGVRTCTAEIRKRTDPARASSYSSQAAQQQERVIESNECVGGSVGGFCVRI